MDSRLGQIYSKYNQNVRPLICEIEGREEQFAEPVLLDIANMFDELSLCYTTDEEEHYEQAEANLNLCVSHSCQYLVVSLYKSIEAFKKRCDKKEQEILDRGAFYSKFSSLEKKSIKHIRAGRNKTALDALDNYRDAYKCLQEMEDMTIRELPIQIIRTAQNATIAIWTKWIISVLLSVAVGVIVNDYQVEILRWISSVKIAYWG